ncbi:TPA: hypothetical protein ACKRHX_002768 [Proteus mirabilis]|nr:hypothetical protein [Proteus mirabilis]
MIEQLKQLKWPLIILLFMSGVAFTIFAVNETYSNKQWIASLASGFGVSFISIIATVILINMFISQKDKQQKNKIKNACIKTLRKPIDDISNVVFNIVKATSNCRQEDGNQDLEAFFRYIDISHVRLLNTSLIAPVLPQMSWDIYLLNAFEELTKKIQNFIEKYAVHLDFETIDLCEKIATHVFVKHLRLNIIMNNELSNAGVKREELPTSLMFVSIVHNDTSIMSDYFGLLADLTKLIASTQEDNQIIVYHTWGDHVAPKLGSALINYKVNEAS